MSRDSSILSKLPATEMVLVVVVVVVFLWLNWLNYIMAMHLPEVS